MSLPGGKGIEKLREAKDNCPVRGLRTAVGWPAGTGWKSSNSFRVLAGGDCSFRSSFCSSLRRRQQPWQVFPGTSFFSQRFCAIYDRLSAKERTTTQSPRQASVRQRRSGIVSMSLTGPGN